MSDEWSDEELEAAVRSYVEIRSKESSGKRYVKKEVYESLAKQYGRSVKSYEYRLQNISYVYSLMGRQWVSGLKPAKNIGAGVAQKVERLIHKVEGNAALPIAGFYTTVEKLVHKKGLLPPDGVKNPSKSIYEVTQISRDPAVVSWVLLESKGSCENCKKKAPFQKEDGTPFLEVHHLRHLSDGGSDTVSNAVALCPNCHREFHYGKNRVQLLTDIYDSVTRLVRE